MGEVFETITQELRDWINQRQLFFVATAPLARDGLINCSPKGLDSFRILGPTTVAYADLTGSGIETAAHLKENGRIAIMFCAFDGPAKIVRLHGRGRYLEPGTLDFQQRRTEFGDVIGLRGIVEVSTERISDSCGYGVPKFEYLGQRETLIKASQQKGEAGLAEYRREKNRLSIDGLPGI
jgi:hypothetical protein